MLLEYWDAGHLVLFSIHNLDLVANFFNNVVFVDRERKVFVLVILGK